MERTVKRWYDSGGFAEDPPSVWKPKLALLEEFCSYMESAPDELVESCFVEKGAEGKKVRSKRRREITEAVDRFCQDTGRTGHDGVAAGNVVRSFFIHNGVFMQGVPSVSR